MAEALIHVVFISVISGFHFDVVCKLASLAFECTYIILLTCSQIKLQLSYIFWAILAVILFLRQKFGFA